MSEKAKSKHLFISYAYEDEVLAEWLALKLIAEGYRVWCDRFKLLGGESYPSDIDDAIKNKTFRFISLLSRSSIDKANPKKERTLAFNIAKERKIDFIIPLNVDNLKPTELPWQASDITFIPFYNGWEKGLKQLLKKLTSINAPRPLKNGRKIAAETFLPNEVISQEPEFIYSNCLRFQKIPGVVHRYKLSRTLNQEEIKDLSKNWAFYKTSPSNILSFHSPPKEMPNRLTITRAGGASWTNVPEIDGIRSANLVSSLLYKSLRVKCLQKGLKVSTENGQLYFPQGILEKDHLNILDYNGSKTWISVTGKRKFWSSAKSSHYLYHLSPEFWIKQNLIYDFIVQLRTRYYFTDTNGEPLEKRSITSRRKHLAKNWWNHEWLIRLLAVCHFLADGQDNFIIGQSPKEQIIISAKLIQYEAPFGINEEAKQLSLEEKNKIAADMLEHELE